MNQFGKGFLYIWIVLLAIGKAQGQCTSLRQQRDITFNTNRDCAPVDVTDYTITYFFNSAQDPNDIQIRFEWNDPANTVDIVGAGDPGFVTSGGGTEFSATGTFSYPQDENCLFEPAAYIVVNGDICETSEQIQLVSSWAKDNNFGGDLAIEPFTWDVCYGNAVVDAVFEDASVFNCNINDEPDNPNRQQRVTQFVYGVNHDPNNTIRNLELTDENGNIVSLTDANGNLTTTRTVNGITAGYFGPFDQIPFPADGPVSISLPLNAPAENANLIGSVFRVTLFNWNVCNPFNGDVANPNYADAVTIDAFVRIVAPPAPDFQTRVSDQNGRVQDTFCLGDQIYFDNLSGVGLNYQWEFYEDTTASLIAGSSNLRNPAFSYEEAGPKLIRLTVENPNVRSQCLVSIDKIVTISPAPIAAIEVQDPATNQPVSGTLCQKAALSDTLSVLYTDATTRTDGNTSWRWEFYDQNDQLLESMPAGAGNFSSTRLTNIQQNYIEPGAYRTALITRNSLTGCETATEINVFVYPSPEATFTANEVCERDPTLFSDITAAISGVVPRLGADSIVLYEFDFSYEEDNFTTAYSQVVNSDFEWYLNGDSGLISTAGTYRVAMRTTSLAGCSSIYPVFVTVRDLPEVELTVNDPGPVCSGETLSFINALARYSNISSQLAITNQVTGVYDTLPLNADSVYYTFFNDTDSVQTYAAIAFSENEFGCTNTGDTVSIDVLPNFSSNFSDINYDPLTSTCSPYEGLLVPATTTRSIKADRYVWTIYSNGQLLDGYPLAVNRGDPEYDSLSYTIANDSTSIQTYQVILDVEKANSCINSSEFVLQISPQPSSDFTVNRADSCEYAIFTVEATQQGLNEYLWSFDPQPDQRVNEGHRQLLRYNRFAGQERSSEVSLTTANLAKCVSDLTRDTVRVNQLNQPLSPDFELSVDTLRLPDSVVSISQESNFDPSWVYKWRFGNGEQVQIFEPGSVVYTEAGDYQITLDIVSDYCAANLTRSLIVLPAAPMVDFRADSLVGCQPHTVQFSNLSQFADPNSYFWDFGDGTTSTQQNPSHTYRQAGVYTVSLYAENQQGAGAEEVKINYIEVLASPTASFQVNPRIAYIPDQQVFFNNLSLGADRYRWDFGDGASSDSENPAHTYAEPGLYSVTLIASNELGCADTLHLPGAVEAIPGGKVRTPNAFTPNTASAANSAVDGSTLNDIFIPRVEGITDFEMLIYNKWGQLLFRSTSQEQGWDGYFQGRLMPADVYVYKLYLTFSDGRKAEQIGDVTLVR